MSADREAQARRAREVLDGAGWLFDDFVNAQMHQLLTSAPQERKLREECYRRAQTATRMKAYLLKAVEDHDADKLLQERRDLMLKEFHNGR